MHKTISTLAILLMLSSTTLGQEAYDTVFVKYNRDETGEAIKYGTDTLLFESELQRQILIGTTIVPWTNNQIHAKGYGIDFNKVTKSNCQGHGEEKNMEDRINSITQKGDSIVIDFNLYANCCHEFLCDISVDEAGVLNLMYTGYGNFCGCTCCFGLTYHLSVTKDPDYREINAVMINGDPKTLKKM